jgi:hypothetical protein
MAAQSKPRARIFTTEQAMARLLERRPRLTFSGSGRASWRTWRRRFRARLLRELGEEPPRAPLRIEITERTVFDGYVREKLIFDADAFSSVPCWLLTPAGLKKGERRPAVLCAHGHGAGKDGLVGVVEDLFEGVSYSKQFPIALARRGFVTLVPDWRSFGERRDRDPYLKAWEHEHGWDGCDLSHLAYGYFGYELLRLNLSDAQRCLDVLAARPDVDPARLGAMGCSFGGTMTTLLSALDLRVKAAVISGYVSTIGDALGPRGRGNTCGSQFMRSLRSYGDIADVAGLIAPRSCQVQIGKHDTCFIESDALSAFGHLQRIYRAAGATENLQLDRFDGGHEIDLDPALAFLEKQLRPEL